MRRRAFVTGLGAVLAVPLGAEAEQAQRIRRVGLYATTNPKEWFADGLRGLGWVDGRNIVIDWHNRAAADVETAGQVVADMEKRELDVAVVGGPHLIRAAMRVTKTIPLIGIDLESDPVASGFVKSLARPGLNISGVWLDLPELAGKELQLLRDLSPAINRVAVLLDDQLGAPQLAAAQTAARSLNLALHPVSVRRVADIDDAWKQLLVDKPQAVLSLTAPVVFQSQNRIAELARLHRLPSICAFSTYAERAGS